MYSAFILVALTVTPCSTASSGLCPTTEVVRTFPSETACHEALSSLDKNHYCIPAPPVAASKQDKEMRALFFSTFEKFIQIAKEDGQ